MYPCTEVMVTLDGSQMKDGDFAGLAALQGCYAFLALTKDSGTYRLIQMERNPGEISQNMGDGDTLPGKETAQLPISSSTVSLKMCADFTDMKDEVTFFYKTDEEWVPLTKPHKLYFKLDHFVGCRAGLFLYSTAETGGTCIFSDFSYMLGNLKNP